jgi:hypothetical protein
MDGKAFFIDRKGVVIIDPGASEAKPFSEELAAVKIGKKWGFIDKTGEMIIKPQFAEVSNFKEGFAKVRNRPQGYWGYIDKTGQFIIKPQFDQADNFSEGMAGVFSLSKNPEPAESQGILSDLRFFITYEKSRFRQNCWNYIDKKGNPVIPGCFSATYRFHNGVAQVWVARNIVFFWWDALLFRLNLRKHCVMDMCDCGPSCYKLGYIKRDGTYLWPLQN